MASAKVTSSGLLRWNLTAHFRWQKSLHCADWLWVTALSLPFQESQASSSSLCFSSSPGISDQVSVVNIFFYSPSVSWKAHPAPVFLLVYTSWLMFLFPFSFFFPLFSPSIPELPGFLVMTSLYAWYHFPNDFSSSWKLPCWEHRWHQAGNVFSVGVLALFLVLIPPSSALYGDGHIPIKVCVLPFDGKFGFSRMSTRIQKSLPHLTQLLSVVSVQS